MKKHIPNILTMCNLWMGCLSIVFSSERDLTAASVFIFVASIFDFLDGFIARLLNVKSKIGKELDSLADCVSFGVAPTMILFFTFFDKIYLFNNIGKINIGYLTIDLDFYLVLGSTFAIAVFSALRLAKFNIDERQTSYFIGLPTPANALVIACLPFILKKYFLQTPIEALILNSYSALAICWGLSLLLVSPLRLISMKIKHFGLRSHKYHIGFAVFSMLFIVSFDYLAAPIILLLYIGFSLLYFRKVKDEN